jgi:hypothetical protein
MPRIERPSDLEQRSRDKWDKLFQQSFFFKPFEALLRLHFFTVTLREESLLKKIHTVLMSLMKMGLMERMKPRYSRGYGYYVAQLYLDADLALPHPSEINDPVIQGKPVEIVNPITGLKEKI